MSQSKQRDLAMRGTKGSSAEITRWIMLLTHALSVSFVWSLLLGRAQTFPASVLGLNWQPGDQTRRYLLVAFAVVYFIRVCFTLFYLLRRKVGWQECALVSGIFILVHPGFALLGGRVQEPIGWTDVLAIALYTVGSYFNTGSEVLRELWRRDPHNAGKLYTGGMFRFSRHINYFGDAMLFSGYAMLTHTWWAAVVPVVMAAGFLFYIIPDLDEYLSKRYGPDFQAYSARTRGFVPWFQRRVS